ncbi:MAG TPA: hypothetical protein VGJ97_07300 [Anaerolineaceae bacterium]
MHKLTISNKYSIGPVLLMCMSLAACAAAQPTQVSQVENQPTNPAAQNQPAGGPLNLSLENKLAIGTLKLEGTSQAVTAKEAQDLLPLWQQVQTLGANKTTAPTDYQGVYQKIEAAMTSEQVQTIRTMSLTSTDIRNEMQSLGIQGGQNAGGFQGLSADQRATRVAQMQTQNPGGNFGGGTPGARPRFSSTPNPQRTPGQGGSGQGGFGGRQNTNLIFLDALIKLLQTRSAG